MSCPRVGRAALALALAAGTSVACDGRPKTNASSTSEPAPPRRGPEIAVVDLSEGVPEIEAAGFLGVPVHRASFDRLVRSIGDVAKDDDVKGIFVRFGDVQMGIARAQEIGDLLEPIRKGGKPIFCHADAFTNATLFAAARGCSNIWVSPAGEVEAIGIAAQIVYFHKLLAEELHVTVDFLQVGKFKGAEESFTRDGPSDEARASLEGTLADLRGAWIDGLKKGRGRDDVEGVAEDGPYSPAAAKDHGLIDNVGYADDALAEAKKAAGAVREETRFGHGAGRKDDDLGELVQILAGSRGASAPVALIRASGSIGMAPSGGPFGGEAGITEHEMARLLARAEKDDAIKAVVLRIDSPGGSALASDLIWHELRKVRSKKPVVVSVGGMAASGGYYISSAATQIFAEPTSILGSIGVVGGKLAVGDALQRFGVHAETFPARKVPGAAERASASSPLTGWDAPTRARILETMTGIYELFLARVADGRGTTPDKIAPFAEGRLFSGTQAKEHGLVDELGGLNDAYAKARSLASLPADANVEVLAGRSGFLEALDSAAGEDEPDSAEAPLAAAAATAAGRAGVGPFQIIDRFAPDLVPYVTSLGGFLSGERALTALPYALVLR
jgi:protease IV